MGILNVTPDSFSDGGQLADPAQVLRCGQAMQAAGAAVVDVGGESTRPGAEDVPAEEELRRVLPAVRVLVGALQIPISVDTRKARVFREAYAAGASLLNDVSGLSFDPDMVRELAATDAAVVVMHMRGNPRTMDSLARYDDVVAEVGCELGARLDVLQAAGIARDRMILDPGLGFAKDNQQNLEILRRVEEFHGLGFPLAVGPSRKRFLGAMTGREVVDRDAGTVALVASLARKGVELVRVHAVGGAVDAVAVTLALEAGDSPKETEA